MREGSAGGPGFWVGTGWKMNMTAAEARAYVEELLTLLPSPRAGVQFFIVPPFTALASARAAIGTAPLLLGAQNMHWAESGAYTGEISARMLAAVPVNLVELGHSERRAAFGETDETVNAKVKAALAHGLRPLVCVGDSAAERDAGTSAEAVVRQVKLAFAGVAEGGIGRSLVAYEPIWAIGTGGVPAAPAQVRRTHEAIHAALAGLTPHPVPVLYGGSVTTANCAGLAGEVAVDGLFVGRAAWSAKGLSAVIAGAVAARSAAGLLA